MDKSFKTVTIEKDYKETLVSCIMPTYNRRAFVPNAIRYFLRQDYVHKELIIIDDGTDDISDLVPRVDNIRYYRLDKKITLGAKLNLACTYAKGNIIANWDDDDWYAERRLSYQVGTLQHTGTAVCGINKLLYYDLRNRLGFQYIYPPDQRVWLLGSSLCFTKELWATNVFADINVGMDGLFVWATAPERVKVLEDASFSVHMIHENNVSPKNTNNGYWHTYPVEDLRQIMDADWNCYINDGIDYDIKSNASPKKEVPALNNDAHKLLRNVYACLVHENEDCIIDLVRNLNYLDPASRIILYNGGNNAELLTGKFAYEKYGASIHPVPVPQKHGYLHKFGLDCMEYALNNFSFDTLTIVDSDQLGLRPVYSEYLSKFISPTSNVGMFSNMPEPLFADEKVNLVAAQLFREISLWEPFFETFPGWENKSVYWTYWPATIFTFSAVRDLVKLFKQNNQLQNIMQQTKIWATEEVIFPTLVKLLGYEIAANPCNNEVVKYRRKYTVDDIDNALKETDIFWIHPIERHVENEARQYIRTHFKDYAVYTNKETAMIEPVTEEITDDALIKKIKTYEGWLDDEEARVLIEFTRTICNDIPGSHNIVETGSYHGKSTVLFGCILKALSTDSRVFAIDTHDGQLGAEDMGLKSYPPSYDSFKKNIEEAGLTCMVESIKSKANEFAWNLPVSFLFIDGLHDYQNVNNDFWHFEEWIKPRGYVAFHDYADYYPGVKTFVNELLLTKKYDKIKQVRSLIILQRAIES